MTVSAIGLGGMPMSITGRPDRDRSIATIHAALDAGVTLIDTADAYTTAEDGQGHNEELIAEALGSYPSDTSHVLVATKGGLINDRPGQTWSRNGAVSYLKSAAKESLARLGGDAIGLYQFHREDPSIDYAESIGALADLIDDGTILMAGISNATIDMIEIAQRVLDGQLVSVQNQFSPLRREGLPELEYCMAHGIAYLPWSPLGGIKSAADLGTTQSAIQQIATQLAVSPHRVALAWELALGEHVIPIPGASRPTSIIDSAQAADLDLTAEQIALISAA